MVLSLLIIALAGCNRSGEKSQAKTIKFVKVETVGSGIAQNIVAFNGKVKEKSLTPLSFRVAGPLAKLNVKQGDYVRAGQVIAEIDRRDYELQVQTTKARFTQVESEYKRYKILIEQNKIPENTFEKVKSGYLMAKTAYENAQNQLKDTRLKAPFTGYIYQKYVENFQTVNAGTPIVSLIDNSLLEAVVSVPESQLQLVKNSKTGLLTIDNANVNNLPVKLLSVSEKTMSDGLYQVKYSFKNNNNRKVAPGMTAEIAISDNSPGICLSVASAAVFHEGANTCVWVYNPSSRKVGKRKVSIALDGADGRVNIVAGLTPGEQVVTAGVHYLVEGQEVKPIKKIAKTNVEGLL